jgi:hypothetical protein
MSGQLQAQAALPPGERAPGNHWIGGWVGPRAGLDDVKKRKFLTLPGLEFRLLGRPAHSQSLYRLRYPGSRINYVYQLICYPTGHEANVTVVNSASTSRQRSLKLRLTRLSLRQLVEPVTQYLDCMLIFKSFAFIAFKIFAYGLSSSYCVILHYVFGIYGSN